LPGDRGFHGLHVGLKTATPPLQSPGLDSNWDELLSIFGVIRAVLPEFRCWVHLEPLLLRINRTTLLPVSQVQVSQPPSLSLLESCNSLARFPSL
jgi:hypothetical protein